MPSRPRQYTVPFPKTLGQATYTVKNGKQYKGGGISRVRVRFDGVDRLWCQVDRFGTAEVFPDLYWGHAEADEPVKSMAQVLGYAG
jgi:hypothetical protein